MKELSTSEITKEVLLKLKAIGYTVWRQNNLAVRNRIHIGKLGLSDVIGYTGTGIFVACEVKKIGDEFSEPQKEFLRDVKKKGGIALYATQEGYNVVIKEWDENVKVPTKVRTRE